MIGDTRHSYAWKQTRLRILERDGYVCQIGWCGGVDLLSLPERERQVDHIVPVAAGGTDDDWNLRVACAKCNTSRQDREFARVSGTNPRWINAA
ncbi:hypothetical protein GCM10022286_05640 [Gryllotalpicola daejeonensis]|uniref:HNH nuclease domain-containing protein n=1 Tax=Gryllotalpicola daejeonensis TaxID=993087 RepID=A0ABP7ZF96_9MICO